MKQGRHSSRLFVAATAMLLLGSLAGVSGLVLCRGANGHLAIEIDHSGTGCPTLASSEGATGTSVESAAECFDLLTAGADPIALSSFDAERVPMPPVALLAVRWEPATRIEARLPASTDARAGPFNLALHLTSTVLLV